MMWKEYPSSDNEENSEGENSSDGPYVSYHDVYPDTTTNNYLHGNNGQTAKDPPQESFPPPQERKWYPGKLLGFKRKDSNGQIGDRGGSTDSGGDKQPSPVRESRNWFRSSSISKNMPSTDDKDDKEETQSVTDHRKERLFAQVVRKIRNKVVSRQLRGRIYIHRAVGLITTAMTCEVTETSELSADNAPTQDDYGNELNRAITMTDTIINSLERRSMAWEGVDFADEVMLTRGGHFAISGPIIGIMGFSFTLEITASALSLLSSRKRLEAARACLDPEPSSSFSTSRFLSFSFLKPSAQEPRQHHRLSLPTSSSLSLQPIGRFSDDLQEQHSFDSESTLETQNMQFNGPSNFSTPFHHGHQDHEHEDDDQHHNNRTGESHVD